MMMTDILFLYELLSFQALVVGSSLVVALVVALSVVFVVTSVVLSVVALVVLLYEFLYDEFSYGLCKIQ